MNETEAREIVLTAIADVAPELDSLDPDTSLRDGADLDSMDFLAYISGISDAIDADIPEDDYGKLDTVNLAVAYLTAR